MLPALVPQVFASRTQRFQPDKAPIAVMGVITPPGPTQRTALQRSGSCSRLAGGRTASSMGHARNPGGKAGASVARALAIRGDETRLGPGAYVGQVSHVTLWGQSIHIRGGHFQDIAPTECCCLARLV